MYWQRAYTMYVYGSTDIYYYYYFQIFYEVEWEGKTNTVSYTSIYYGTSTNHTALNMLITIWNDVKSNNMLYYENASLMPLQFNYS